MPGVRARKRNAPYFPSLEAAISALLFTLIAVTVTPDRYSPSSSLTSPMIRAFNP